MRVRAMGFSLAEQGPRRSCGGHRLIAGSTGQDRTEPSITATQLLVVPRSIPITSLSAEAEPLQSKPRITDRRAGRIAS